MNKPYSYPTLEEIQADKRWLQLNPAQQDSVRQDWALGLRKYADALGFAGPELDERIRLKLQPREVTSSLPVRAGAAAADAIGPSLRKAAKAVIETGPALRQAAAAKLNPANAPSALRSMADSLNPMHTLRGLGDMLNPMHTIRPSLEKLQAAWDNRGEVKADWNTAAEAARINDAAFRSMLTGDEELTQKALRARRLTRAAQGQMRGTLPEAVKSTTQSLEQMGEAYLKAIPGTTLAGPGGGTAAVVGHFAQQGTGEIYLDIIEAVPSINRGVARVVASQFGNMYGATEAIADAVGLPTPMKKLGARLVIQNRLGKELVKYLGTTAGEITEEAVQSVIQNAAVASAKSLHGMLTGDGASISPQQLKDVIVKGLQDGYRSGPSVALTTALLGSAGKVARTVAGERTQPDVPAAPVPEPTVVDRPAPAAIKATPTAEPAEAAKPTPAEDWMAARAKLPDVGSETEPVRIGDTDAGMEAYRSRGQWQFRPVGTEDWILPDRSLSEELDAWKQPDVEAAKPAEPVASVTRPAEPAKPAEPVAEVASVTAAPIDYDNMSWDELVQRGERGDAEANRRLDAVMPPAESAPTVTPTKKRRRPRREQTQLDLARSDVGRLYLSPADRRELKNAGITISPRYVTGKRDAGMDYSEAAAMLARDYPGLGVRADAELADVVRVFQGKAAESAEVKAQQEDAGPDVVRAADLKPGDKFKNLQNGETEIVVEKQPDGTILTGDGIARRHAPGTELTLQSEVGRANEDERYDAEEVVARGQADSGDVDADNLRFATKAKAPADRAKAQALLHLQRRAKNALPVAIVQAEADLPQHVRDAKDARQKRARRGLRVSGVYDPRSGKVWFVLDNIKSPREATATWFHEQGLHRGIRGLIPDGARLNRFLTEVARQRGLPNAEAAEEYLARLAEKIELQQALTPQERTLWGRFVQVVRASARALGVRLTWTPRELAGIVRESARWTMTGQGAAPAGTSPRFSAQLEFGGDLVGETERKALAQKAAAALDLPGLPDWARATVKRIYDDAQAGRTTNVDAANTRLDQTLAAASQQKAALRGKGVDQQQRLFQDTGPAQGTLFRADPAGPVWHSQVEKTVQSAPQNKMQGAQWLGWLKKQPGVKQEELDWIGLPEWLAEQKGSVTKADVAAFVAANRVEVQDVVKGAPLAGLPNGDVQYDNYQFPGGENYREVLLTMPVGASGVDALIQRLQADGRVSMADGTSMVLHEDGTIDDGRGGSAYDSIDDFRDSLLAGDWGNIPEAPVFTSSHFPEPNILAHVRLNERTDADGNRVLFIEEVQSDWHQQGREKGYDPDHVPNYKIWATQQGMTQAEIDATWRTEDPRYQEWETRNRKGPGVPDAPFKQSWPMLAMKRMIRWAAENGFDRLAWTTGEQQAERYDLSKQVDSIDVLRESPEGKEGVYAVNAEKDGYVVVSKNGLSKNALAGVIGKELAARATADTVIAPSATYSGLDLKVGGEGMKGFYDAILPAEVNKYVKKWGGRVGATRISPFRQTAVRRSERGDHWTIAEHGDTGGYGTFRTREEAVKFRQMMLDDASTVHALDITPAMKDAAMQGQPLFRITPDQDAEYLAAAEAGDTATARRMVDEQTKRQAIVAANAAGLKHKEQDSVWWSYYSPVLQSAYDEGKRGIDLSGQPTFEGKRFGKPPKSGMSFNAREGVSERGVSLAVRADGSEIGSSVWFADRKPVSVRGLLLPNPGSDGEAVVLPYSADMTADGVNPADAITRDSSGRIVPLSQRFNPDSPDIRFRAEQEQDTSFVKVSPSELTREVLARMDKIAKREGYDSRGADDVKEYLLDGRKLSDGHRTSPAIRNGGLHGDWAAFYREATAGVQKRKVSAQEPGKKLVTRALRAFGATYDPLEAGYVLPDGRMLDFSGKRDGGPPHARAYDHRDIARIMPEGVQGTDAMRMFQHDTGAMRVDWQAGMVDLDGAPPTAKQEQWILRLLADRGAEGVYLDLFDNGRRAHIEPVAGSEKKVLGSVRRFFSGENIDSGLRFSTADPEEPGPRSMEQSLLQRLQAIAKTEDPSYNPADGAVTRRVKNSIPDYAAIEDPVLRSYVNSLLNRTRRKAEKAARKRAKNESKNKPNNWLDVELALHDLEQRTGVPFWHLYRRVFKTNRDVDFESAADVDRLFDGLKNNDGKAATPRDILYSPESEARIVALIEAGKALPGTTDFERAVATRIDALYQEWKPYVKRARHGAWMRTGEMPPDATPALMEEGKRIAAQYGEQSEEYARWIDQAQFGVREKYLPHQHEGVMPEPALPKPKRNFRRDFLKLRGRNSKAKPLIGGVYSYVRNARRVRDLEPLLRDMESLFQENHETVDPGLIDRLLNNLYGNRLRFDFDQAAKLKLIGRFFRVAIPQKIAQWSLRNLGQVTANVLPRVASPLDPVFWKNLPRLYNLGTRVGHREKTIQALLAKNDKLADYYHRYVSELDAARQEKLLLEFDKYDIPRDVAGEFWRYYDAVGKTYTWTDTANRAQAFLYGWHAAKDALRRYQRTPTTTNWKRLLNVTGFSLAPDLEQAYVADLAAHGKIDEAANRIGRWLADSTQFRYVRAERALPWQEPGKGMHVNWPIATYWRGTGQMLIREDLTAVLDGMKPGATAWDRNRARKGLANLALWYLISIMVNKVYEKLFDVQGGPYGLSTLAYIPGGPVVQNMIATAEVGLQMLRQERGWDAAAAVVANQAGEFFVPLFRLANRTLTPTAQTDDPRFRAVQANFNMPMAARNWLKRHVREMMGDKPPRDTRKWVEYTAGQIVQRDLLYGASRTTRERLESLYADWKEQGTPETERKLEQAFRKYPLSTRRQFPGGTVQARDVRDITTLVPGVDDEYRDRLAAQFSR